MSMREARGRRRELRVRRQSPIELQHADSEVAVGIPSRARRWIRPSQSALHAVERRRNAARSSPNVPATPARIWTAPDELLSGVGTDARRRAR
jgi:hypothetical protein